MKRYLLVAAGAFLFIALLSAYVTLSVASDLRAVKETLDSDTSDLEPADVEEAELRLRNALTRLDSLPARMLRFVPVVGQNIGSLREVVATSIPTLQAGLGLSDALEDIDSSGLVTDGRIDLRRLQELKRPVDIQIATLKDLTRAVRANRNGWLVPPLWNALDSLAQRSTELLDDASAISSFLEVSDDLLGGAGKRTYLVLLINNSELRGAGGILSGVGAIKLDDGRLQLGRFTSVHKLRDRPPRSVPAPAEYEERFEVYKANTTLWLNATFSPSVPDVSLVAARLYELKTGVRADGVLTIDPRGVTALLPPDEDIALPGTDIRVRASDAADFIYSDAYVTFEDQIARRDAILELGRQAFEGAIDRGLGGQEGLSALAAALGGEHIRFNSFEDNEAAVLEDLGVTGALGGPDNSHHVLVTTQNFGGGNSQGTKLDFWAERKLTQDCRVARDEPTLCETTTELANEAPGDLITYVAGKDGVLRSYLETYVPAAAEIGSVKKDGEDVEFRVEPQEDMSAVGLYVEVPRGERTEVVVRYSLPEPDGSFALSIAPQPLARDARLDVKLQIPRSWVVRGAGELTEDDTISFEGELDRTYVFEAGSDPRTGIPQVWETFKGFWSRPLF